MQKFVSVLGSVLLLSACKTAPTPEPGTAPAAESASASSQPSRASDARARLNASAAGKIVLRATQTHGGLDRWFGQEAIHFRYDYAPLEGLRRNSVQTIDVQNARAYHDLEGFGKFAWDGKEAFKEFDAEYPIRFWALTPYYFVGLPFVLSDAGVNLQIVNDEPADVGLPPADVVKATFNVGDAPDDYYVLYFAKDDGRMMAARYIVTYSPFYKADPERKPKEKIILYEEFAPHDGIVLAGRQDTFKMEGKVRGEKVTVSTLSEVQIDVPFDESRMRKSETAIVDHSMD